MATSKKDWLKLRKKLKALGCVIDRTSGSHFKVYYQGRWVNTIQNSNSDPRAMLNTLAELRRNGVPIGR